MAKHYGDIEVINGEILNLKVETLDTTPEFTSDDLSRIIFTKDEGALKVNDGSEWITVQFSNSSSQPLVDTLGKQWINNDSTLDPTQFNDFHNITDLTSNDSLFTVLKQLDQAIAKNNASAFTSLPDVHLANPQQGDVIILGNNGITNINLTTLAAARLSLKSSDLKDVKLTAPLKSGQILKYSTTANAFVNASCYFEYLNSAANTTFVVAHNLNKQHVFVQVINLLTNKLVTDNYTVTYNTANSLTVTVTPSIGVKVLVWSFIQN